MYIKTAVTAFFAPRISDITKTAKSDKDIGTGPIGRVITEKTHKKEAPNAVLLSSDVRKVITIPPLAVLYKKKALKLYSSAFCGSGNWI